jgi:hypothetical protein
MKFYTLNWVNYSNFSKKIGPFNTLKDALYWADHKTPTGTDCKTLEEYSEVIECDAKGNVLDSHYFISDQNS